MTANKHYIAHVRSSDGTEQTVAQHLTEVAVITKNLAIKLHVPEAGELIGLPHAYKRLSCAVAPRARGLKPSVDTA